MAELRSFAGEITMLADMGFADLDANQRLLVENDGNVQAVLDELLAMQFDAGREPAAPPGEGGGEGPEAPPPVGAGGAAAGAAAEYDFDDVPPPVPPALLRRQTSAALIDFFAERGLTEREVLPEYRAAWRAMCLDHALLSSSREGKALARLNDAIAARPLGDFSAVVEGAIRKAYALGPGASARGQKCMVEGYTIFDNVAAVHAEVGWRAKYVHASLRGLSEAMEPGQLIGLLATLTKGGHECLTRKRYAASTLIDLYPEGGAGLVGGDECPFGLKVSCPEGSSAPDGEGPVRRMAAAKQSLLAATEAWLDEHKDRAFDAAFIRPTRCYERATGGDEISEGNAKVHGGNTYSAVVLACLGVALPQRPYLADHHSQGRRAFLRSAEKCPAFSAVVDALVEPKNLGRDVPAVRSVRLPSDARSEQGFIFSGDTPRAIACGALDPSPANAPRRAELARYLARFAALLSAEVVLEPLFVRLYEERREVLALPCRALRAAGVGCWARGEGEDEEDVATKDYRLWVFNEELDYAFDGARALLLFAALGIIRPELHPPDTAAAVAALEATVDPGSAPALLGLVTSAAAAEAPATAAAEAPALGAAATSAPDAVTAAAAEKSSPASLSSDGEALTAALGGPPVFDGMDYSAPMEAFLAAVGLKDAAGVAAHLEDEYARRTPIARAHTHTRTPPRKRSSTSQIDLLPTSLPALLLWRLVRGPSS